MARADPGNRAGVTPDSGAPLRRRWVTKVTVQQERRLYFVATIVLATWHLLTRLL